LCTRDAYFLSNTNATYLWDITLASLTKLMIRSLTKCLMELSKSQDQITAGLANGDPAVLPKIAELLQKTLSTETL